MLKQIMSRLSISASDIIPVRIIPEGKPADEPNTGLLEIALAAHQDAYKELSQGWRSVETKAQGTVGLAGIFMAAAFAFARDLPAEVNGLAVALFAVAVALLACSAAAAVWAQRVRTIPAAPTLLVHQWVEDIRKLPADEQAGRLPGFYEEYNDAWFKTNQKLLDLIRSRARSVMVAQVALLLAGTCVSAATIITLLTHQPAAAQEEAHAYVHQVR
jgi:hypothetical protein